MKRLLYPLCTAIAVTLLFSAAAQKTNYPNTLLWRISGNGLSKPSYLYGTMHLADRRLFQFSDSLYHYLERSEGYAMEVDPDEIMAALMDNLSAPDTTAYLFAGMDKKEFKKVAADMEKQFGIPADKITRKQAWLYRMGWKSAKGKADDMDSPVDTYLYNLARRQGKWVGGIEDVEDQLDVMSDLSKNFDASDVLVRNKDAATLEKMISIYTTQDMNTLYNWTFKMDSVERYRMLTKRNDKMALRMDSMARIRSHFFAVGAAHLPGADGVIDLLKAKGFSVEPVVSAKRIKPEQYRYTAVVLPWYPTQDEDKTFTASMPGKAVTFNPNGTPMKMQLYADMGTGIFYFMTSIPLGAGESKDSFMTRFVKNATRTDKSVTVSKMVYKGINGVEVYRQENGYFYRLRLLPTDGHIIMAMLGSQKKSLLTHPEAERFCQSVQVHTTATISKKKWYTYNDPKSAIQLDFPSKPVPSRQMQESLQQEVGNEAWNFYNQTSTSITGNMAYILVVKEARPGFYIISDREMFSNFKTGIDTKKEVAVSRYDTGYFAGCAAMWLDGTYKSNNLQMRTFHVNKGNRSFSLMAIYEKGADTTGMTSFFQSFRFTDYQQAEWKVYSDSARSFTTMAPAPIEAEAKSEDEGASLDGYTYTTYDKGSGYFMQVNVEGIDPYSWAESDSAFFAAKLAEYKSEADSLVYAQKITNGPAAGMEYGILMGTEQRNFKKLRILLHNDSTYTLSIIAPQAYATSKTFEPFFTAFRFTRYVPVKKHLTNKTEKLFADLQATDSATIERAREAIADMPFTKKDLPRLHQGLLERHSDFSESVYCAHDALIEKVVSMADASTVAFVKQQYIRLGADKEVLKYPLLRVLAGIKTAASYAVLKDLLVNHTPKEGRSYPLMGLLVDSLLLTKTMYPELLALSADSLFFDVVAIVSNRLIDSNLLQVSALLPYQQNLLAQTNARLAALQQSGEDASWSFYNAVYLLGKINTPASNQLLQQIAQSGKADLTHQAVLALLKNKQTVAPALLEKIAADTYYRLELYRKLKEDGQLSLFPARYATQRSLAESELFQLASDDEEPSKLEFIGERTAVYKGEKKKFYLFKIIYQYDEETETYLGVTGPYEVGSKTIVLGAEASGFAEGPYNPKTIETQFKKLLQLQEEYATQQEDEE